jgi:hypothetical protein
MSRLAHLGAHPQLQTAVRHSQFSAAAALRLTGWVAVTLLVALGLVALAVLALGNFTLPGTMLQLDNLASRYVAANAARQAQFNGLLLTAFAGFAVGTAFFRRFSLMRILKPTETTHG